MPFTYNPPVVAAKIEPAVIGIVRAPVAAVDAMVIGTVSTAPSVMAVVDPATMNVFPVPPS